jgi:DNA-binding response OmpR family regulator
MMESRNKHNKRGYILLVEDEPVVQANNKMILERRGYQLQQAYTLEDARVMIAEEPPRAIILDIQMPDGNGLDLLQEVRSKLNTPVLVLTAMGTPKDIVNGLEAGGDDYLTKPYDLPAFLKRVEILLRRAELIAEW